MTLQQQIENAIGCKIKEEFFEGFICEHGKAYCYKTTPTGKLKTGSIKRDYEYEKICSGHGWGR